MPFVNIGKSFDLVSSTTLGTCLYNLHTFLPSPLTSVRGPGSVPFHVQVLACAHFSLGVRTENSILRIRCHKMHLVADDNTLTLNSSSFLSMCKHWFT